MWSPIEQSSPGLVKLLPPPPSSRREEKKKRVDMGGYDCDEGGRGEYRTVDYSKGGYWYVGREEGGGALLRPGDSEYKRMIPSDAVYDRLDY
jgi:hypothetical protein